MLQVESFKASVRLMPLFTGKIDVPLIDIEKPNLVLLQDARGRSNWDFTPPGETPPPSKPFKLPPIEQFVIAKGRIHADIVPRKITFDGEVDSIEPRHGAQRGKLPPGRAGLAQRQAVQPAGGRRTADPHPPRPALPL